MKNRRKDEHGDIVNWLMIKNLQYRKDKPGAIFYKYEFSEDYKTISMSECGRLPLQRDLENVYNGRLAISEAKKDLLKLCDQRAIPAKVHHWYRSLTTSRNANIASLLQPLTTRDSVTMSKTGTGNMMKGRL